MPGSKGYPIDAGPMSCAEIGAAGWHLLDGRLPLPLAVLRRAALEHNIAWMQRFAGDRGIDLAPHGKTTMSPQLFRRQLAAGAWGMTLASVGQASVGVAAGARRILVANQVLADADLRAAAALLDAHDGLRLLFLVDSLEQLTLIERWCDAHRRGSAFEVLLEVGVPGGRTGCRVHEDAVALARAVHASRAVRLAGIECFEGLAATGRTEADAAYVGALMDRVEALARQCAQERLFEGDEVVLSAGGSAVFDLVAARLRPAIGGAVRGLLRSGCYITHDHGSYARMLAAVSERSGAADTLRPALEVWAHVQSRPESKLAILGVGRRDISFDIEMPVPVARAARGERSARGVPSSWKVTALNDQHAYLRWEATDDGDPPTVGERIGLGISHPCTTFDKWRWMPVVEDDYRVTDAVTTRFG